MSKETLPSMRDSTKLNIAKLIKQGFVTETIRKKYGYRYSRQQVAAIRAWVTMGKRY